MSRARVLLAPVGAAVFVAGLALACGPVPGPRLGAAVLGAALVVVGAWAMDGALRS